MVCGAVAPGQTTTLLAAVHSVGNICLLHQSRVMQSLYELVFFSDLVQNTATHLLLRLVVVVVVRLLVAVVAVNR